MVAKILIALSLLAICGCQATTRGSFCQIENPIRISAPAISSLSDAEVRQILAHNRKGEKLCGWHP